LFEAVALGSAPRRQMHPKGGITSAYQQPVSGAKRSEASAEQQVCTAVQAEVAKLEPGSDHGA
jgi:hypothetical protein